MNQNVVGVPKWSNVKTFFFQNVSAI